MINQHFIGNTNMKTLCITGSVQSRLDSFAESLGKAGATAALPARCDQALSIAAWHRKVLTLREGHESPSSTWSLGHEWEQLAEEIFLANHTQPLWYWADTGSTQLLDFWFNFAPNTFFLLLHTSPHEALMDAVEHGADTLGALQDTLEDWYKRTRQMLRFHLRHPSRSILLDSSNALGQAGAYIDALAQRWQLPLEAMGIEQARQSASQPLTLYLVDKFLQNQPQALALHHEVQASLFFIDGSETPVSTPELHHVLSDYLDARHLFQVNQADNDFLRRSLKDVQSQLANANLALQDRQARLADLEKDHQRLQGQTEQYWQELSSTRSDLENSDQENRLLLEQLRHTRENFEKLAQEDQHKAQQLDELNSERTTLLNQLNELARNAAKEKGSLTTALNEQTKLANERKAQIDKLEAEKNQFQVNLNEYRQELSEIQSNLESSKQENQLLLDQLHQTQEELEKLILEEQRKAQQLAKLEMEKKQLQEKIEQYWQQLSEVQSNLEKSEQENQLLLDQLHQTQEEFEKLILEEQRKAQQLSNLNAEKNALVNHLDTLSKEKTELVAARDALAKEKADLVASRDVLSKEKAALTAAHDALTKEKAALAAARDEQLKLANERKAQLDNLAKEHEQQRDQINRALEESENENQQLIIELHKTQEDLERSLLLNQSIQTHLGKQQARLQKVLKHHPDYWDFDTLEISPQKSVGGQQVVQWHLTELYIGGRLIPEIRFKTCLANGLAGIIIQRTEGTDSPAPLLRWPNIFAAAEELPCIPTRGASTQGSNAALSGLSTSDWDTIQHLAKQLAGFLAQATDSRIPKKLNTVALRNGLLAFAKTLAGWPRMLRYDSIQLQETLRNQGYERLGISLGNLRLGHHHWPALDYRLATVDTKPHSFGQNPRLEFPEGGARNALQNWFAENSDSNGSRLELRFAKPNAMDTRVWGMLSQNDQQLISALIKTLPLQLEELKQANPATSRPWQDWQALAGMLRDTLRDILIRSTAPRRTPAGIEE